MSFQAEIALEWQEFISRGSVPLPEPTPFPVAWLEFLVTLKEWR